METPIEKESEKKNNDVSAERRGNSQALIEKLVTERAEMLSLYKDLASMHPFDDRAATAPLLQRFCQALIDYTADVHFRLYKYIEERRERRRAVVQLAGQVYPQIVDNTQDILAFNSKYEGNSEYPLSELERDLSRLGEGLADRIDLEDQILQVMLQSQ